jgi:Domain of unknown function (DUF4062)
MVIQTPDQRLRVFVSSTVGEHSELAEERRAVARAISALRLTPVLFELEARPHPHRTSTGPIARRAMSSWGCTGSATDGPAGYADLGAGGGAPAGPGARTWRRC